jgi:hypothetical protein
VDASRAVIASSPSPATHSEYCFASAGISAYSTELYLTTWTSLDIKCFELHI